MQNLIYGVKAVLGHGFSMAGQVTQYELFWGFALGFLVSTLVHGFLITDPKMVSTILLNDRAKSFEKLNARSDGGSYTASYAEFSKKADNVKFLFGLAALIVMLLVLAAFLAL